MKCGALEISTKAISTMDYHKTDIHRRILRNIALNVELIFNNNDTDVSEYDVQAFLSLFLRQNLRNTSFAVTRETCGKFDCAIRRESEKSPIVLYELKTYLKPHEKLNTETQYKKIVSDLRKLKDGSERYTTCRGYFLLVCKANQLEELHDRFEFISEALRGNKNWIRVSSGSDEIRLRPSVKECSIGRVRVLSWEVKRA